MKIGYFVTYFPYIDREYNMDYSKRYVHGGAEDVAYNLATKMMQKGHEVDIFTTSINSKESIEKYESMNIHRYGTNFRFEGGNIAFKIFRDPLKYQVEIVHVHHYLSVAPLAAMRYSKKEKIPLVLTYHGDGQESVGGVIHRMGITFYNNHLLNRILSSANVIISPSEYYINESRFLGNYREKIVVIPNGIDPRNFDVPYTKEDCRKRLGLPLHSNIILFVGKITSYKGPDVLVRAMPEIIKNVPDTELVFVGSGELKGKLEELSNKLGIFENVKFTGFVDERLKPLYYKAADVFCLPSTLNTEVFPIVLLEASASGLPMVTSDLNTFKCIIEEGYNGLFTKRGDENNLADAIIYLLENEEVRNKMGKNARKKVEDYSWEKIAEETERVYEMVTNDE
jgi:glycosyltransferase involved in cell wall biosynthesis